MTLRFNKRLSITPIEEGGGQPAVEDIKYTDFSSNAAMTLADGIIYRNNTSGTGYIDTEYNVTFTPEQWQKELIIQAHIKTPSSFNDHGHWILGSTSGSWNTGIGLTINKDAGYTFWFMLGQSDTTLSVDFSGTTVPQLNKEYWVRLYKPNTENESHDTLFQISTDGINWTTEASRTIANIASNYTTSGYLRLLNGYWGDIYNQFEGGIYFDKDTFVSIDGEKVWYLMDSACEALKNQNKSITVNGTYTADTGYTGLGTVTVNVPSSGTYTTMTIPFNNATLKTIGTWARYLYWFVGDICWSFGNFVGSVNVYYPDESMRGLYPYMLVRGIDVETEVIQPEAVMYFKITDNNDVELVPFTPIIVCFVDSEHLGSQCYKSIFGDYVLYWWIEKVDNVPAISVKDVTYQGTSVAGAKLVHEIRVKQ